MDIGADGYTLPGLDLRAFSRRMVDAIQMRLVWRNLMLVALDGRCAAREEIS